MKKLLLKGFLGVCSTALVLFSVSSCKEPGPPKGILTILDSAGTKNWSGANVRLYSIVDGNIIEIKDVSDASGKVYVTLKLPANLNVDIWMPNPSLVGDTLIGGGYMMFEEGKTTEKAFNIK